MTTETQALVHRAENGEADEVREATKDFIRSLDPIKVRDYFHAAGSVAIYSGDGGAAWMLRDVLNRPESYGTHLKESAINMLFDKPHFFNYFTPDFTEGVVSRIR